jgi:tRNA methyltransferase complex GCD14 subunit N-term/tRNA methyltransferase complex GCD14 subunit
VTGKFAAGDRVLLVDNKGRRHLVSLEPGGQFHTHAGIVAHDDLIDHDDGQTVRTSRGARLVAVRPTLAEYVLEMPRGAQVIYPKDIGPILVLADVFPGARILESGVGSGALTTALLRAIGPTGHITGYEIRDDFAQRAVANVHGFLGDDVPLDVEVRDVYEGVDERDRTPARRHSPGVLADDSPGRPVARGDRELTVRHGRDGRGAATRLARRRAVDPARSPDGRAHRFPHPRTFARAGQLSDKSPR